MDSINAQNSDCDAQSSANRPSTRLHGDLHSTLLDNSHPLHIHSSDTPGTILVSQVLTGSDNYRVWSKGIRLALMAKNKLGFIDGTCTKESYGEELAHLWTRCNAFVQSWILNSVSKELYQDILYPENASEVWRDLKERYDKVNGSRIFFLHRAIGNCTQDLDSISVYFTKLKHMWTEFATLVSMPDCECARSRQYQTVQQQLQLLQFLNGLNVSYNSIRSQMLLMDPLPTLNQAYSMLIQEETQRVNMAKVNPGCEQGSGSVFTARNQSFRVKDPSLVCSHCKP